MTTANDFPAAKLYRRIFAIIYDSLLLLAVLLIAAAVPLLFTGGVAIQDHNLALSAYYLSISFVFFGWFWTHGGQTLGMRAWRLQVLQTNGQSLTWLHALLRFLSGLPAWLVFIIGIFFYIKPGLTLPGVLSLLQKMPAWSVMLVGLVWLVIDNLPDSWRDQLTGTRIIQLGKQPVSTQSPQQDQGTGND